MRIAAPMARSTIRRTASALNTSCPSTGMGSWPEWPPRRRAPPPLRLTVALLDALVCRLARSSSLLTQARRPLPLLGGGPPTPGILAEGAVGEQRPGQRARPGIRPLKRQLGAGAVARQHRD